MLHKVSYLFCFVVLSGCLIKGGRENTSQQKDVLIDIDINWVKDTLRTYNEFEAPRVFDMESLHLEEDYNLKNATTQIRIYHLMIIITPL